MAAQGAIRSLRVIELGTRQTVVDQKNGALLETLAHCCDPRFNAPANFRAIVVGKRELAHEGLRIAHEELIGKAFAFNETPLRIYGNTERAQARVMDDKSRARQ